MAKALTAIALKNLKPAGTRREISDGGAPGLYFVVQTTGAMSWVSRCRVNGKPMKVALGRVNLEQGTNNHPELGG